MRQRRRTREVDVFVLETPPEALDHHIVDPAPLSIDADADVGVLESLRPVLARVLATLVGRIASVADRYRRVVPADFFGRIPHPNARKVVATV